MQRRRNSKRKARNERDAEAIEKDSPVERCRIWLQYRDRRRGQEHTRHQSRQDQSSDAAGNRQCQALGQQLPDDTPAGRTEGCTHGDFVRSRSGARQHQGRNVDARKQQ